MEHDNNRLLTPEKNDDTNKALPARPLPIYLPLLRQAHELSLVRVFPHEVLEGLLLQHQLLPLLVFDSLVRLLLKVSTQLLEGLGQHLEKGLSNVFVTLYTAVQALVGYFATFGNGGWK